MASPDPPGEGDPALSLTPSPTPPVAFPPLTPSLPGSISPSPMESCHLNPESREASQIRISKDSPGSQDSTINNFPDSRISSEKPHEPPSSLPWASRVKSSLRNLQKMASPTFREDGTPVVKAPASILLKGSEKWTDYLIAKFTGNPPPQSKIYSDLNPIWGKFGNITLVRKSKYSFLIYIPNRSTREWVLQVGYWQTALCGFVVSEWSPNGTFQEQKLTSVPIWVNLSNIPLDLFTLQGISLIASAIGEPMHTENSRLSFRQFGEAKVKVEILVDSTIPAVIEVEDDVGDSVFITANYPRLPAKCDKCKEFGHSISRCPKPALSSICKDTEENQVKIKDNDKVIKGKEIVIAQNIAPPSVVQTQQVVVVESDDPKLGIDSPMDIPTANEQSKAMPYAPPILPSIPDSECLSSAQPQVAKNIAQNIALPSVIQTQQVVVVESADPKPVIDSPMDIPIANEQSKAMPYGPPILTSIPDSECLPSAQPHVEGNNFVATLQGNKFFKEAESKSKEDKLIKVAQEILRKRLSASSSRTQLSKVSKGSKLSSKVEPSRFKKKMRNTS